MKLGKPFLTVQCSGGYTKTLEVIEYIGLNTLQTGLGGFDAVSVDTKGQVFGLDETVVASDQYLTVYAFSTENWKRPQDEVNALMKLLRQYLKDCIKRSTKNNMCVRVIGDITPLEEDMKQSIKELEEATKDNTGLHFQVALNYGSRDEMTRAMRKMTADVKDGKVKPEDISEELFAGYLDTKGLPDPDLLIRTSGEERLSNFMLWQLAYTEFYFTDVLWPDFNKKELQKAIDYYNKRDRRFGGV